MRAIAVIVHPAITSTCFSLKCFKSGLLFVPLHKELRALIIILLYICPVTYMNCLTFRGGLPSEITLPSHWKTCCSSNHCQVRLICFLTKTDDWLMLLTSNHQNMYVCVSYFMMQRSGCTCINTVENSWCISRSSAHVMKRKFTFSSLSIWCVIDISADWSWQIEEGLGYFPMENTPIHGFILFW